MTTTDPVRSVIEAVGYQFREPARLTAAPGQG